MLNQRDILPSELNMSARVITDSVNVTSTAFGCNEYAKLTLEISTGWAAASDVQIYLESSVDQTTWYRVQSVSTSAGTATLSDLTFVKSVSAADQWAVNIPINYQNLRIVATGTSADGVTDAVTITARLGR